MKIEVNLNDYMYVKLTEHGRAMHRKHHRDNYERFAIEYREPKTDENGISEFQIWEFMQIFGSYMYNGCKPLCEMNVEVKNSI